MTTATATVTVNALPGGSDITQKNEIIYGTIAIGASPATYATGGLVLSFAGFDTLRSNQVPVWVSIQSSPAAGTSPSGFVYQFCPGTTIANGKVAIFESAGSAAALAELGNGSAIPAGVSGDVIVFRAEFPRL